MELQGQLSGWLVGALALSYGRYISVFHTTNIKFLSPVLLAA